MARQILYHYCSTEAFKSIIESGDLYFSSAYLVNDPLDSQWAHKHIQSVYHDYLTPDSEQFFSSMSNLLQSVIPLDEKHFRIPFIACFSKRGDVLSQWRAYAYEGKGFSIGFDANAFGAKPLLWPFVEIQSLRLVELEYNENRQKDLVRRIISQGCDHVANKDKWSPSYTDMADELGVKSVQAALGLMCGLHLLGTLARFKNPAFKEEQEWRLLTFPELKIANGRIQIPAEPGIAGIRTTATKLLPYFAVNFRRLIRRKPIVRIYRGPLNETDDLTLRAFLLQNEYQGVEIRESNATLRG